MRVGRTFTNDFKRQVVESIVSGSATQAELSREYKISSVLITRWKKDYRKGKFFENVNSQDIAKLELRVRELERLLGKLTLENEMLKRARDLNTKEKKEDLSIITSRDWERSKGGVKQWILKDQPITYKPKGGRPSDADLADRIEEIALEYPSYVYRRVTAELKRQGLKVNHKSVYRIMKQENILCRARKSFKVTTNSAHCLTKHPN